MREDFEIWLFNMDDILEEFISSFPDDGTREQLNYSIESLNIVEDWMLKNFKSHSEFLISNNKDIHDKLSRYIGETFRKNLKCKWSIRYDDPKFAFYGLPILVDKKTANTIVCPHTLASTAIARSQHDFLSKILINNLNKLKIE